MQAPITDSRQPPLRLSLGIWSLAASFYLFGFFHRVTPGVLTDELSQSFHLSHAGLGNLSAFYFYFYAAMQVPVGLLVDRIGPRAVLTAGCLLGGLGAALFGLAPNLAWAAAGRGLVGGSGAVSGHVCDTCHFAAVAGCPGQRRDGPWICVCQRVCATLTGGGSRLCKFGGDGGAADSTAPAGCCARPLFDRRFSGLFKGGNDDLHAHIGSLGSQRHCGAGSHA